MAITSPYCTKTEVRLLAREITTANVSDVILDTIITEADYDVETDLSGIVNVDTMKDLAGIPVALNRLSTILSRIYSYKYHYGNKSDPTDTYNLVSYWQKKYTTLLERIRVRKTIFLNSDNEDTIPFTYTNSKLASRKRFGSDRFNAYDSDVD